jgi:hypothetical protein
MQVMITGVGMEQRKLKSRAVMVLEGPLDWWEDVRKLWCWCAGRELRMQHGGSTVSTRPTLIISCSAAASNI